MPSLAENKKNSYLNANIFSAYQVLAEQELTPELAQKLTQLSGTDLLDLVSLANKVKQKFNSAYHLCTIMNAKSGACSQDCKFCAQSSHNQSEIDTYALVSKEKILAAAKQASNNGVENFGIVTSGKSFLNINKDFQIILDSLTEIHKKYPKLKLCASLGMLSETTAKALAKHHLSHYNINLQTNPKKYASLIATTHAVTERIETIQHLQKYNINVCSGGIIGLGENLSDRVELALTLRSLAIKVVPINILIPIPGTPLAQESPLPISEIVKTFAIFRLILPKTIIKFAAGRETLLKDFQGLLMLAGANGMLTGGYLTTRGRSIKEDQTFLEGLETFYV